MFDNIQRFILHVLAENIAQACTLLVGLAFKDNRNLSVFPLAPVQIIWIIMVSRHVPHIMRHIRRRTVLTSAKQGYFWAA